MNVGDLVLVHMPGSQGGPRYGRVSDATHDEDGRRIRKNQVAVSFYLEGTWGMPPKRVEVCDIEMSYADVADELNDGTPGQMALADLDSGAVYEASVYARQNNLPWPPQTGDFDRYCERKAYEVSRREG